MDQQPPEALNAVAQGPHAEQDAQANRDIAALSYVWILSLVIYVVRKESPFIRFHARQGITLFLLSIVFWFLPLVGQLLELIVLALAVLGFLAAAQGQWKELPVIGALSRFDVSGMRAHWCRFLDRVQRRHSPHPSTPPVAPAPPPAVPSTGMPKPPPPPPS